MSAKTFVDVEYLQGIHVVDSILWCDAPRQADLCFISHAHLAPIGPHKKILLSEETASLLGDRLGKTKALISPYYRRFSLGGLDLELAPSGHMLGASQIRITRKNRQIVYTGDFQLEKSRTAQPATILEADVLVMPVSYGSVEYQFPKRSEVEQEIVNWAHTTIESNAQPLFFAAQPGKAQELAKILSDSGLTVRVHRSIYQTCKKYAALGVEISTLRTFSKNPGQNELIIFPINLRRSKMIANLKDVKTAIATGKAVEKGARARWNVDAAFALSGHADHAGLIRYISDSNAKKILLVGATAQKFAAELRDRGFQAWPLKPPRQMDFFHSPSPKTSS
jgi:putative mRNA 3-end processing factor